MSKPLIALPPRDPDRLRALVLRTLRQSGRNADAWRFEQDTTRCRREYDLVLAWARRYVDVQEVEAS